MEEEKKHFQLLFLPASYFGSPVHIRVFPVCVPRPKQKKQTFSLFFFFGISFAIAGPECLISFFLSLSGKFFSSSFSVNFYKSARAKIFFLPIAMECGGSHNVARGSLTRKKKKRKEKTLLNKRERK
jgi:hypothetical protein